jgi:CheY-like chemotaxis protein
LLAEVYPAGGIRASMEALGFSRSAVKNRARVLGLRSETIQHWTAQEDQALRELYESGVSMPEIAKVLGRPLQASKGRAVKLGTKSGRSWTPEEIEIVRTRYVIDGAAALAKRLLGDDSPIERYLIYRLAERLGISTPTRHPPEVLERVRTLHAQGMTDGQIAKEMNDYFPGRSDRERVTAIRHRLGLPAIVLSREQRQVIGRKGREKQLAAGFEPRARRYQEFAARYNLPIETPPRAVEILLSLISGPKTRPQIEEATGKDPAGIWNALGTSYIGGLERWGFIAITKLPGASNKGPRKLYLLTPAAIDLLAKAGDGKEQHANV